MFHEIAKQFGLNVVNLLVDYKTPDGVDMHTSMQGFGADKYTIASGALHDLTAQGLRVMCLYTVPGDYDLNALRDMTDDQAEVALQSGEVEVLYMADELRTEIRAAWGLPTGG